MSFSELFYGEMLGLHQSQALLLFLVGAALYGVLVLLNKFYELDQFVNISKGLGWLVSLIIFCMVWPILFLAAITFPLYIFFIRSQKQRLYTKEPYWQTFKKGLPKKRQIVNQETTAPHVDTADKQDKDENSYLGSTEKKGLVRLDSEDKTELAIPDRLPEAKSTKDSSRPHLNLYLGERAVVPELVLEHGQRLDVSSIAASIWGKNDEIFSSVFEPSEEEIKAGASKLKKYLSTDQPSSIWEKDRYKFQELFGGIHPNSHRLELYYRYSGDSHGGSTEYFLEGGKGLIPLLSFPFSPKTLEGFVQTFYLIYQLPKFGNFWHGLYGRDYELLIDEIYAKPQCLAAWSSPDYDFVNPDIIVSGLLLESSDAGVMMACLAKYPSGSIVQKTARVVDRHEVLLDEKEVFKSSTMVLY